MKYFVFVAIFLTGSLSLAFDEDQAIESRHYRNETREVRRFLRRHEVDSITSYCFVGQFNCRSVVFYKDRVSGERVPSFEDRFVASTANRSMASRAFFLKQANGNFNAYGQDRYQNEIRINLVEEANQNIPIDFDSDGYPSFDVSFFIIGTPELKVARLQYTSHWAEFTGDLQGKLILKP